ncbi:hypothetical protein OG946_01595 [Streptomyces sp. NBC_01808]|uniref:hypothetical protein n=1 Tax=Streptomyces sp. NBC_01808 TaxID=2975947 RepID=UPI002DD9D9AB|nr:hypothetical protein [Streptomyces sp. NBC_01808]WSA36177.1 hypothetical protein OG946_01595 [Streptomyces sp. NBC_01808]
MPTSSRPHLHDGDRPRDRAPAAAPGAPPLAHYAPLARLAYLTLPPALGRHRRVLTAHAAVQRALAAGRSRRLARVPAQRTPAPREPETDVRLDELRVRVLRYALRRDWARSACRLDGWRGEGVRAVNNWVFAQQRLPEDAGRADWVCSRAATWRGQGRVVVQLQPPARSAATPGRVVAAQSSGEDSAACSRFGRHVLASTDWRAPSGDWYLLAAGSRDVRDLEATGEVTATAEGPTLAERAEKGVRARVTGRVEGGGWLATGR